MELDYNYLFSPHLVSECCINLKKITFTIKKKRQITKKKRKTKCTIHKNNQGKLIKC